MSEHRRSWEPPEPTLAEILTATLDALDPHLRTTVAGAVATLSNALAQAEIRHEVTGEDTSGDIHLRLGADDATLLAAIIRDRHCTTPRST